VRCAKSLARHACSLPVFFYHCCWSLTLQPLGRTCVAVAGQDYCVVAASTRMSTGFSILKRDSSLFLQLCAPCQRVGAGWAPAYASASACASAPAGTGPCCSSGRDLDERLKMRRRGPARAFGCQPALSGRQVGPAGDCHSGLPGGLANTAQDAAGALPPGWCACMRGSECGFATEDSKRLHRAAMCKSGHLACGPPTLHQPLALT